MTREEAWSVFGARALGEVMRGVETNIPGVVEKRTAMAAKWADAMTDEWAKRFTTTSEEQPKRRRSA